MPRPPRDLTGPATAREQAFGNDAAHHAFDDDSAGEPVALEAGGVIGWDFGTSRAVHYYTLIPLEPGDHRWTLETADPDGGWRVVDDRRATFTWPRQTRIFAVDADGTFYRFRAGSPIEVAQVELFDDFTRPSGETSRRTGPICGPRA